MPRDITETNEDLVLERVKNLETRLEETENQAEYFKEAYSDAVKSMLAMDSIGWNKYLSDDHHDRFSLTEIKDIGARLGEWTDTNPLLWRGHEIRTSYLFGSGYDIGTQEATTKISKRAQDAFENPLNQAAVFSQEALSANEKARYTQGNLFMLFDRDRQVFSPIPLEQISDAVYNPDDRGELWYIQRKYSKRVQNLNTNRMNTKDVTEWYPVDTYKPRGGYVNSINGKPVIKSKVVVDSRVNRPIGQTWGMPDSFAAAPWALAYSDYLRDGAKVLRALADFAWKLTPKKKSTEMVGAKIKSATGAGGTVVTDMEMQSLPRANAVDLGTGRPLAAQVASALGISVVILLSDPGQSGAYGTAQTLTDPTIRTMKARQDLNSEFLMRCLRLLGITKPSILWKKMAPDADYREMQTKIAAVGTGAFHVDEFRGPIADLAGFTLHHEEAPDGFMLPNNTNSLSRKDIDADASGVKTDGSTPLTNGQGRDNTQKPSYGDNDLRDEVDRD